jgi:hypothetical protein
MRMILKTISIILSVLIIAAAGYVAWWMLSQATFQIEAPIRDGDKLTGYAILVPQHENLANAAKYLAAPVLLLSLGLLAAGIFQKIKTQITLALLIAAAAIFTGFYGFPTDFVSATPLDGENIKHIFTSPGSTERLAMIASFAGFILGLVTVGISIAQLVWARKKSDI